MISRGGIGKVGEHLVIAELIQRGFKPFVPVVDDHGVDIMLPNGNRIQVKAANLSVMWHKRKGALKSEPTGKKGYQFSLQRTVFGTKEKLQSVGLTYEYRDFAAESDFLVLVGLDERRFWIVRTSCIDGCGHILISEGHSRNKLGPRHRFWQKVRAGENEWEALRQPVRPSVEERFAENSSKEILQ